VPRRQDHDRIQHGGEQDQHERDAVDSDCIVNTERRDPADVLVELEPVAVRGELGHHRNGERKGQQRYAESSLLDALDVGGG